MSRTCAGNAFEQGRAIFQECSGKAQDNASSENFLRLMEKHVEHTRNESAARFITEIRLERFEVFGRATSVTCGSGAWLAACRWHQGATAAQVAAFSDMKASCVVFSSEISTGQPAVERTDKRARRSAVDKQTDESS